MLSVSVSYGFVHVFVCQCMTDIPFTKSCEQLPYKCTLTLDTVPWHACLESR